MSKNTGDIAMIAAGIASGLNVPPSKLAELVGCLADNLRAVERKQAELGQALSLDGGTIEALITRVQALEQAQAKSIHNDNLDSTELVEGLARALYIVYHTGTGSVDEVTAADAWDTGRTNPKIKTLFVIYARAALAFLRLQGWGPLVGSIKS